MTTKQLIQLALAVLIIALAAAALSHLWPIFVAVLAAIGLYQTIKAVVGYVR